MGSGAADDVVGLGDVVLGAADDAGAASPPEQAATPRAETDRRAPSISTGREVISPRYVGTP